jgi:hypothetical protein
VPVGRLLLTDWGRPFGDRARPMMHFIFDGGTLADGSGITVQEEELDGFRFTATTELPDYLPSYGLARVTAAISARAHGTAIFLPHQV